MGTLYLDRKGLSLALKYGQLQIREPGGPVQGIPVRLLERVVLQGNIAMDSTVLTGLADQGADVLMLSGRHSRRLAVVLGKGHGDARRRLAQYRLHHQHDQRLAWTQRLIQAKLLGQRSLLRHALSLRPDRRRPLQAGISQLSENLVRLAQAHHLDGARGYEGSGAAAYFSAFCQLFPGSLNFHGRNRRPPRDPVNAGLSLGYTLLHFEAITACHRAGLDPLIGFLHEPAFGRESLALDLIEPLRPRLDHWLWNLFRERWLTRMARFLVKQGYRMQYSVFAASLNRQRLSQLLSDMAERIDSHEDDIRVYPLPDELQMDTLGVQLFPANVLLIHQRRALLRS